MDSPGGLPINIFDAGVIGVLLLSAIFAYTRGFVHEVLAVAGWVGAIFATIYGFPFLKPYFRSVIAVELFADLAAGVVIFVVALVVLSMLTRTISGRVQNSALNSIDRALGFLFGLARGAVIVCIAYLGLELMMPKEEQPDWVKNARSLQLIEPGARILTALVPDRSGEKGDENKNGKNNGAADPSAIVRELLAPSAKGSDAKRPDGYNKKERQDIERLIGTSDQPK